MLAAEVRAWQRRRASTDETKEGFKFTELRWRQRRRLSCVLLYSCRLEPPHAPPPPAPWNPTLLCALVLQSYRKTCAGVSVRKNVNTRRIKTHWRWNSPLCEQQNSPKIHERIVSFLAIPKIESNKTLIHKSQTKYSLRVTPQQHQTIKINTRRCHFKYK